MMDDLSISDERLERALRELPRINRLLGGHHASCRAIEPAVRESPSPIRILDVGTGIGDYAVAFQRFARRKGREARITGVDLNPRTIEIARSEMLADDPPGVEFRVADARHLPYDDREFDVAHAALFLHHFETPDAVLVLREMARVSGGNVVINDLHRHYVPYVFLKLLGATPLVGEMFAHDGPVSVLRGFLRAELESLFAEAGLAADVSWRFAFRWLASSVEGRR